MRIKYLRKIIRMSTVPRLGRLCAEYKLTVEEEKFYKMIVCGKKKKEKKRKKYLLCKKLLSSELNKSFDAR